MNLTGKVRKSDGTAVRCPQQLAFTCRADNPHHVVSLTTAADGSYSASLSHAGIWDITVNGGSAQPTSCTVDVPAGWCTKNIRGSVIIDDC
jgi:hypothetical protein